MPRRGDNDVFTSLNMIDIDEDKKTWPFLIFFKIHMEVKMLYTGEELKRMRNSILYSIQNLVKQRHLNPTSLSIFFLFIRLIALIKKDSSN